jgi:V/A-type H+-transporting ATPase subunit E
MKGIEKILEHISSESAAECDAIAKGAAEECERIRAEYARAEQDEYWELINGGTREAERRLERMGSLAALESKKLVLATQQEMIAAAFDLAAKRILGLPEREYIDFLAKLACSASLTGTETIILSKSDYGRLGPKVLEAANAGLKATKRDASLKLSDKPANIRGGLILSGGDIEANCSIDALITQYRNELSPKVAAELFG